LALIFRDTKGAPLTHGEVDGNFRHLTGSHEISGSINVNGNITGSNLSLSGTDSVLAVASISASGGLTGSHLFISGNSQIDGNLTLGGNMIGGDSNTDSVTFNADVTSNIRPNTDDLYDIGTTTQRWKDIHAVTAQGEVSVQNHITASGTATLADEQYGIWIGPFSISGTVDIGADSNFVVTSFNRMNKIDLLNYSDY
tara:strand:+ start:29600 stop:30193 length:594 start_codon:yes stop_codon:yes gene_type:complete